MIGLDTSNGWRQSTHFLKTPRFMKSMPAPTPLSLLGGGINEAKKPKQDLWSFSDEDAGAGGETETYDEFQGVPEHLIVVGGLDSKCFVWVDTDDEVWISCMTAYGKWKLRERAPDFNPNKTSVRRLTQLGSENVQTTFFVVNLEDGTDVLVRIEVIKFEGVDVFVVQNMPKPLDATSPTLVVAQDYPEDIPILARICTIPSTTTTSSAQGEGEPTKNKKNDILLLELWNMESGERLAESVVVLPEEAVGVWEAEIDAFFDTSGPEPLSSLFWQLGISVSTADTNTHVALMYKGASTLKATGTSQASEEGEEVMGSGEGGEGVGEMEITTAPEVPTGVRHDEL
ncbi:hypothetical protein HK102_002190 [Quaeritorhiza haematococci]|nr:hypothetical protein HK102_002190 [Quaeritorhiza haematococci]